MLFSVSYKSTKKQEADEIKCPSNQLGLIYDLIKDHPEKRVNIFLDDKATEKDLKEIDLIKKVANNYTICCNNLNTLRQFRKDEYNAYSRFPVTDWESFGVLCDIGVSDIYIDGPLGFDCGRLSSSAHEHGIKLRVSPCISPNVVLTTNNNINSFFIRPEDLKLYNPYFDIIDFETSIVEREDSLFDIYKRGLYGHDLSLLVDNLNTQVNNFFIQDEFAPARLHCRQICKIPGKSCHHCQVQLDFAQHMEILNKAEKQD